MNGDRVSIGRPLAGQLIGLRYEHGLRWRAWFFESDLGTVEMAGHDLIAIESMASSSNAVNLNAGSQLVTPVSA